MVKLGKTNITLKKMDAKRLDFENDSLDFVVTNCVFCFVPEPANGLKEIRRVLKLFQIIAPIVIGAFSGGSSGINISAYMPI